MPNSGATPSARRISCELLLLLACQRGSLKHLLEWIDMALTVYSVAAGTVLWNPVYYYFSNLHNSLVDYIICNLYIIKFDPKLYDILLLQGQSSFVSASEVLVGLKRIFAPKTVYFVLYSMQLRKLYFWFKGLGYLINC